MRNIPSSLKQTALVILLLAGATAANAHRDDYLDETLVFLTLEQGEWEGEYWFDYGSEETPSNDFLRHNTALEWGITDHWMVDGRGTIKTVVGEDTKFDAGRIETRYRFGEENEHPVDIALSGEVNWERDEDGSIRTAVEPRTVLSKDVRGKLNFTLNFSEEIPLDSSSPAFLVAFGTRYNWTSLLRIGSEVKYDSHENAGSLIPQLWFAFPNEVTLKLGYSAGFDQNEGNFGRLALEAEI